MLQTVSWSKFALDMAESAERGKISTHKNLRLSYKADPAAESLQCETCCKLVIVTRCL
jgi:hypothetical protein